LKGHFFQMAFGHIPAPGDLFKRQMTGFSRKQFRGRHAFEVLACISGQEQELVVAGD
jgi:hypothetical protein